MDRLFAGGAADAAQSGQGPALFIASCALVPQLQAPAIFLDAMLDFPPETSAAGASPTAL
jgi:hypothetical protein